MKSKILYIVCVTFLGALVIIFVITKNKLDSRFNIETKIILPSKKKKSVVIYTKQNCIYCSKAIDLLKKKKLSYKQIELSKDKKTRLLLINQTGQKTIPYVFINDKFVGGFQDLQDLDYTGNL